MVERVSAFIDGFNVYQGIVGKDRRDLLWLDYRALMEQFVRPDQVSGDSDYKSSVAKVQALGKKVKLLEPVGRRGGDPMTAAVDFRKSSQSDTWSDVSCPIRCFGRTVVRNSWAPRLAHGV